VGGFTEAMVTPDIDYYAKFMVQFLDYLANPAIPIKNYRVP